MLERLSHFVTASFCIAQYLFLNSPQTLIGMTIRFHLNIWLRIIVDKTVFNHV
jgi:hypothetical protein